VIANVSAHRRANAFAQALEEEQSDGVRRPSSPKAGTGPGCCGTEPSRAACWPSPPVSATAKPVLDPEVKVVQRAQLSPRSRPCCKGARRQNRPYRSSDSPGPGCAPGHRSGQLRRVPADQGPRGRRAQCRVPREPSAESPRRARRLPGDSLYGLKRGIEDFKLNYLSDGDDQRGVAYLDQASNRLSEARRLMERDRGGHLDHEQLGEIRARCPG